MAHPVIWFEVLGKDGAALSRFYAEKAESLGRRTVLPPTDPMQGTSIALFSNPEGHVVGLVKPGPPPEQ